MPLQNRVTPFGNIAALPGRGLYVGNRGVLHDETRGIVRRWTSRRWIACRLEYKGIRRRIMSPHRWTELFFLDEAAAFSAGHRPCAECRRTEYNRFRDIWREVCGKPASADGMDRRIHADRLDGRRKRTYAASLRDLPDGAFVAIDDSAWLVWRGKLLEWTDAGYRRRRALQSSHRADVLTPQCVVRILAAGYVPVVHPSATERAAPHAAR